MSHSAIAISVEGLSKDYMIYASPREMLLERLTSRQRHMVHHALIDISLTVGKGQVFGVMGPNGAGKSTLLKIIAGTVTPTRGVARVNGKVSAVLELGTGFTPHNTGRENIAMGCLCMGMTNDEISRKTPEIIAFSELEEFIDRPFQTYSSGMQARLSFAVAISAEPEILIIDEALSVGDSRFQQKCFGRVRALRDAGTTILLVSHDESTISTFCNEAAIIIGGRKVAQGPAANMVLEYQRIMFGPAGRPSVVKAGAAEVAETAPSQVTPELTEATATSVELPAVQGPESPVNKAVFAEGLRYGNRRGEILDFGMIDENGRPAEMIASGGRCRFFFRFKALEDLEDYSPAFAIRDRRATVLYGVSSLTQNMRLPSLRANETFECAIDVTMWLSEGEYALTFGVGEAKTGEKIAFIDQGLFFKVYGPGGIFTTAVVNLETAFHFALGRNLALCGSDPVASNHGRPAQ